MNWNNIKSSGISFAWVKATEGTTNYYTDPDFVVDETGAVSAGVLIGAYHYARYDLNSGTNGAIAEAGWFWQNASPYINTNGTYLMPMLDVEAATNGYSQSTLSQWVNTWCTTVSNLAARSGVIVTPVIYVSSSHASAWFNSSVTQWIPWIADWTGGTAQSGNPPAGTTPWGTWVVWQFNDTNTLFSGPPASCDVDVFNGTMTQLTNTLVIGKATAAATNFWDPGHVNASPGSGGTGTWDNSTANWWISGTGDTAWTGAYAVFAGTAGTVTLGATVNATGMTFSNGGYVLTGANTLALTGAGNIVVPANTTNSIYCEFGGSAFNLSGGGTLLLTNAGNYSGGENIIGPNTTLQVNNNHATGNDGVTMNLSNGGIFEDLDSVSGDQFFLTGCALALLTGGGILENPNGNLTMSNFITGAGGLTYVGTTFTLTLTDTGNNYTGGTIVQSGTLKASGAGTLGSTSGAITVNGGTLDLGGASHTVGAVTITNGTIQDGSLTGTSYSGQGGTISANLLGSSGLTKSTSSTLTLSGANTFTGIILINGGLVQINADTRLGAAPSSPVANQVEFFNGGITSGLRSTGSFTYSANRGIKLFGAGGSVQASSGQTVTYPNVISGAGNLGIGSAYNMGYGTNIFTASNTYTGTTTLAAGTLQLGTNGALPYGTSMTIAADGNTGGGSIFDLNGFSQTIGPLASSSGIGGTGTDTPTIKLSGALTILQTNTNTSFAGVIIGSGGSLTLNGNSTLTLAGVNTYTGPTIISAGTLAIGNTASINNSSGISISAGGTLDVSASASYTLSSSTSLSASGSTTPATINGSTTVGLGSQPINLTYDGSHPSLSIAQGTLSLNGNAFTVNNASGSPLGIGTYTLIQQASGTVSASGSFSVNVTGSGVAGGTITSISVSGGNVDLVVVSQIPQASFSNLTPNQTNIYGTPGVSLSGTVSGPGPIYPSVGETISVNINGNTQNTSISDSLGDFSLNYNSSNILYRLVPYTITYTYGGDASLTGATNTSNRLAVSKRPVVLTGSRPYDGTAIATASILSVSNVVGSDVVTVASGSGTLGNTNVGPETITSFGTLALGGASVNNYTLTGATGTVTITTPPFSITAGSVDISGTNFIVTWESAPGAVYQVMGTTNFVTWTNVGNPITATGTVTSATNPITGAADFFQVVSP